MSASTYTRSEELASCAVHGFGIAAMALALPWLLLEASAATDPWLLVGAIAFGVGALAMFTTSVLYHASRAPSRRLWLRRLDHAAIYLLIAGTYTPFTLGAIKGAWGWSIAAIIWSLALLGIAFKTTSLSFRFHRTSVLLYVAMGWLVVIASKRLFESLTAAELVWLFAGGFCYTGGVAFYLWKSRRYTHVAWHVCVLAGVACHFVAVWGVVAR